MTLHIRDPKNRDVARGWTLERTALRQGGHRKLRGASRALGAVALGAVALGALAIGALAIGRLAIGGAKIRRLDIDELVVRQLRVTGRLEAPREPGAEG